MEDSDEALAARAAGGEEAAFEALVSRYEARVYRLACRLTGHESDAQDVLQETFLASYRGLPTFRGHARFSTWLYRIATNAALDLVRRRPALSPVGLSNDHPGGADPATDVHRREVHRRVHAAVGHLPAEYRAVVVLRDLEGLAYDEIARVLRIPIGTVRSRLSRGREIMRSQLTDLVTAEG